MPQNRDEARRPAGSPVGDVPNVHKDKGLGKRTRLTKRSGLTYDAPELCRAARVDTI